MVRDDLNLRLQRGRCVRLVRDGCSRLVITKHAQQAQNSVKRIAQDDVVLLSELWPLVLKGMSGL